MLQVIGRMLNKEQKETQSSAKHITPDLCCGRLAALHTAPLPHKVQTCPSTSDSVEVEGMAHGPLHPKEQRLGSQWREQGWSCWRFLPGKRWPQLHPADFHQAFETRLCNSLKQLNKYRVIIISIECLPRWLLERSLNPFSIANHYQSSFTCSGTQQMHTLYRDKQRVNWDTSSFSPSQHIDLKAPKRLAQLKAEPEPTFTIGCTGKSIA